MTGPVREPLKIEIDSNVLNHLGIGLYSNTPAVLTEIVANAWDADAKNVYIVIGGDLITITDDGHGMDYSALQKKFLTVGYARRNNGEGTTPGGRQCMGRKGIGKLAMFSLANDVTLISRVEGGEQHGFKVCVDELEQTVSANETYYPEPLSPACNLNINKNGTLIQLKSLNKNITTATEAFLRRRIARRFSVIGDDFKIHVNGTLVTLMDRGFYPDIQFLWTFGPAGENALSLCGGAVKHRHFDGVTRSGETVNGFIGSVVVPEQLKKDDDNNNAITLLANGRIFEEDIQKRIDDSKVFNSYLVGELQYDVIDDSSLRDIAVSSRQGVQENDPRFQEFIGYIRTRLKEIGVDWDEWRRELGAEELVQEFPKLQEWLDSLKGNHKGRAKQLINKINTMRFAGSTADQKKQRREILKAQILAFEKLKIQDNIEAMQSIDIEKNVEEFRDVLITVEDIEAAYQLEVIEQRLAVIKKLDEHRENRVKERVVQEHVYKHLWLVDPSWGYKEHPTEFEFTLTKYLKEVCPDSNEGARLDIAYTSTANRFIVLELKRPGLKVTMDALLEQGTKYSRALKQYFATNPGSSPVQGGAPLIDIVFLVEEQPVVSSYLREEYDGRLKLINASVRTYRDLVNQATAIYEDVIGATRKVSRIRSILDDL
ncbi:BbrUII/HgiDII family restriction enzyme [Metapseudomonas otitidis]|uniref:BbrUII/HgiDII family restriction enzyme n=1 Tax=Metapseudomonas otitidis TaxID=319939 RepID=UPI000D1A46A4|nr:ATP-binding protein [Pseudomonas otitidis]